MKVSVSIITFNHEKFLVQAIEGVMTQQTDFEYELFVGEDNSPDGTRNVAKACKAKYPELTLFLHNRDKGNVFDPGKWNFLNNVKHAKGEYIALLDGDDYWTDPYKLQKQVDFMETHPECSICFTAAEGLIEGSGKPPFPKRPKEIRETYSLDYILTDNPFASATALVRKSVLDNLPSWYYDTPAGFWALCVLSAQKGLIGFINESTAVYRIHEGGMSSGLDTMRKYELMISGREAIIPHLEPKYRKVAMRAIYKTEKKMLRLAWKRELVADTRAYAKKCLYDLKYAERKIMDFFPLLYYRGYHPAVDRLLHPVIAGFKQILRRQ